VRIALQHGCPCRQGISAQIVHVEHLCQIAKLTTQQQCMCDFSALAVGRLIRVSGVSAVEHHPLGLFG